jgi:ribose transport system substrate-binding protein
VHNGQGEVLELQGQAGSDNVRQRHQGLVDGLKGSGLKLVGSPYTDWDTGKALSATEDALIANPNIVCIYAHADAVILGAVQAIKASGKFSNVTTIGIGMYGGGPEAILDGSLTGSYFLDPTNVGKLAGNAVVAYSKGKKVSKLIASPIVFVTKANVTDFPGSDGKPLK